MKYVHTWKLSMNPPIWWYFCELNPMNFLCIPSSLADLTTKLINLFRLKWSLDENGIHLTRHCWLISSWYFKLYLAQYMMPIPHTWCRLCISNYVYYINTCGCETEIYWQNFSLQIKMRNEYDASSMENQANKILTFNAKWNEKQ